MLSLKSYLVPFVALIMILVGIFLHHWSDGKPKSTTAIHIKAIEGNGLPTLVEFGMNSCASCKAMHRVLDELRNTHGQGMRIIQINVLEQSELARQWQVKAIPTQILLDGDGNEHYRHVGFMSTQAIRQSGNASQPLGKLYQHNMWRTDGTDYSALGCSAGCPLDRITRGTWLGFRQYLDESLPFGRSTAGGGLFVHCPTSAGTS